MGGLGGEGGGGVGGNYIISLFFPKTSPCDCFGTEYKEIIKDFVCLGHLPIFLMSYRTRKIAALEFAMGVSITVYTHTIVIESSPIRQILVVFSPLFLYTFLHKNTSSSYLLLLLSLD